jgi:GUN4-like
MSNNQLLNQILIETDQNDQPVDSQALKANLDQLIGLVKQLGQDSAGGLELDQVSVSVRITPEGKVILCNGKTFGTMTLDFKRPTVQVMPTVSSGLSYLQLEQLLSAHKWQEANQETWNLLCQALHKQQGTQLAIAEINQIPCQTLNTIDQLWRSHSQGRFGFSVQKRIYKATK